MNSLDSETSRMMSLDGAPALSEQHFFSFSASAQLVFDPVNDRFIAANQEACHLMGADVPQLLGYKVSQVFASSFPWLVVFTQQLISSGRGWSDQLQLATPSGDQRMEVNGRCTETGGELNIYLSLQRLTELDRHRGDSQAHRHYLSGIGNWNRVSKIFNEFERQNRLLLEAAGEGIYGVDTNGIITFVNPAAEKILGYSAEELAGKNMHMMVHHSYSDGGHFDDEDCPIFLAFKEGIVQVVEDDVFWSHSNKAIYVEYTSTPVRDDGIIVGAVVVFRDVSQKKSNDQELRDALAEVEQLKNRLELEKAYLQEEISSEFNHHRIIGRSAGLQKVLQQIELVAPTDVSVLINGETGTGKELIARAIHESSSRSDRPLIRVNCAAIPEDLFESEFFGHVKGAFTGASSDRLGRFELADGGTLFLDEVGEIPLHLQGKLLRVLQERYYERVGDSTTRQVDVRIIAATNRDLKSSVSSKQFREDLYFRLNVFPIETIPLRERIDDVSLLTQHFLEKVSIRTNKQGLKIPLSELKKLENYSWPGNIRELENVIERQVILSRNGVLRFDGLVTGDLHDLTNSGPLYHHTILTGEELKAEDRRNIFRALKKTGGKVFGDNGAAALLQLKPTTLASRIKKYQIDPKNLGDYN